MKYVIALALALIAVQKNPTASDTSAAIVTGGVAIYATLSNPTMYDAYVQSGRPAAPYAHLDRARVLLELGQAAAASVSAQTGLNLGVPASARRTYLLTLAQIQERAGDLEGAIRGYRELIDFSGFDGDDALGLSRIVALKRLRLDQTYRDDLQRLLAPNL